MVDVCLLGPGGVVPMYDRWLTSLLIRYNGRMILIDCGEGTQIPLKILKWGFKAIDTILFTHYHADHVAGLPGLLLTLGNSGRTEPLALMGPSGIKKVIEGLTVISPELPYELKLIELSDSRSSETRVSDVCIKSMPVDHTLPCVSYQVEVRRKRRFDAEQAKKHDIPVIYWNRLHKGETITLEDRVISPEMVLGEARKGIKVCYCTDTRPTEELYGFVEKSDLLICEGMYGGDDSLDKAIAKKHMLFSEAVLLAKQGNVKELWLTHYSPSLREPEQYIEAAREVFENTVLGSNLLARTIKF